MPARPQTPELESRRSRFGTVVPPVSATPFVTPALTPEEVQARMRRQAQFIDFTLNEQDMTANLQNVKNREGEFAKLMFLPRVKSTDQIWTTQYAYFTKEVKCKSLQMIMDQHFLDWQQNLLMPSVVDGSIRAVQATKAEQYTALLATDGLANVFDNTITKLTMMYFGLPVAPFTWYNIVHPDEDKTHEPDEPAPPARVQRILYAEAPLQFLDGYNSRSFGFPMIRSK